MGSFWGDPAVKVTNKDVAPLIAVIRDMAEKYGPTRALKIATSAMSAINAFIAETAGPKESLAVLDRLREDVIGGEL